MKVLFICRQNVGRSQIAKAFYNSLTNSHDANSAGTHVQESGQTLHERKAVSSSKNFFVLDVMEEIGIDISNYTRTPLTKDLATKFDLIVSMADQDDTPQWLIQSPKYVYWDVKDPRGQDFSTTAKARDDIKHRVEALIGQREHKDSPYTDVRDVI